MHQSSLPAEPFIDWIKSKIDRHGLDQAALLVGINPRQMRGYHQGCFKYDGKMVKIKTVKITTVDNALTHEGSLSIYDLYPDF